jgi:hypothetical protein
MHLSCSPGINEKGFRGKKVENAFIYAFGVTFGSIADVPVCSILGQAIPNEPVKSNPNRGWIVARDFRAETRIFGFSDFRASGRAALELSLSAASMQYRQEYAGNESCNLHS